MKFNTRLFLRIMAVFAIMDLCFMMCACGDWESQAINIIGLIGPALQSIIAILAALGEKVPSTVMTTFSNWAQQTQTALVTLRGLIQSIKTAAASAQPGILNKATAVLQTISSNLQTILPELHIDDPASQAKVEEALAAVIGFIGEVAALVPVISAAKTLDDVRVASVRAKTAKDNFRTAFNGAVAFFGSQYEI